MWEGDCLFFGKLWSRFLHTEVARKKLILSQIRKNYWEWQSNRFSISGNSILEYGRDFMEMN